jgi:hypothetical protein
MARTVRWRDQIPSLQDLIRKSVVETYTREDLERVFGVKRVAAQQLIKAIGEVTNLGGKYVVSRASVLNFLESVAQAGNVESAVRTRIQEAEPVPRPRFLKNTLPQDMRSVMLRDLPEGISIAQGRIEIKGANAIEVIERLLALAMGLQNDYESFAQVLDPPPVPPQIEVDDLREMFARMREQEETFQHAKATVSGPDAA